MTTLYDIDFDFELQDGFRDFSFKHIAFGDVDPIYTMVRNSGLSHEDKKRFIFSHLMVYDLKSSIALANEPDDDKYYDKLLQLFTEAKVGKDRKDVASRETNIKSRVFGTQLPKLRNQSPEDWVQCAIDETVKHKSWSASLSASKKIPTFGEYFSFKLADMIETVFDIPEYSVQWGPDFLKSVPRGSLTGYEMVRTGSNHKFRTKEEIRKCSLMATFYINQVEFFKDYVCPQNPNRAIGVQEIETLLCDYRKLRKGTLQHGDKVLKLKHGIDHNIDLRIAQDLLIGAEPMLQRREELLRVGINNVDQSCCAKLDRKSE